MKIGICASKYVGYELLKFIFNFGGVSFVIVNKDDNYKDKISELCKHHNVECYDIDVNSDEFISLNKKYNIDLVFMLWFPTIVKKLSLNSVNSGFINLHPSYIPWNRGMHPYYWSIVDGSVAGTTIHFIDENIDEGEILFQKKIDVSITDTGESLYEKNINETISLFKENYLNILNSNYELKKVDNSKGSFHLSKDIEKHSKIDLNKKYKAIDLINIMRARSFKNGDSSHFTHNGKKYKINVDINEI
tara:strand:+ start:4206 stop:4946 length:741 start_codon:yes stop_codon:yes gene_type:complete